MKKKNQLVLVIATIFTLAISRLLPHPYNFTPLGGLAILGATYFASSIWKYIVPILAFYISDLLVTNILFASYYAGEGMVWISTHMIWTYSAIAVIVLVSSVMMRNKNFKNLIGASLAGAVLFFLITNFGSWLMDPIYPKTLGGALSAFVAGLPFFPNSLASTLIYATAGYGIIEYGSSWIGKISWSKG